MFGYIKVFENQLRVMDLKSYRGIYCGLCRRIGSYSQLARMLLSFDMVFLALLSEYGENERYLDIGKGHCLKKLKDATDPLDYWACISILMIDQKVKNDVNDGDTKKKLVLSGLKAAYDRCREKFPEADRTIEEALQRIDQLEKNRSMEPMETAQIFADMLCKVFSLCPGLNRETEEHRHLCKVVSGLAKWVYLIDFYDDADKDAASGQYNPLVLKAAAQGCTLDRIKEEFRPVIDAEVEELQRLCDFLPYGGFQPVVSNVLHEGIISVTAKIMMGEKK